MELRSRQDERWSDGAAPLNLNIPLLKRQLDTLAAIIARCDADGATSNVRISYAESEHLEGIYQMVAGIHDHVVN